jgi:long-chain acyl-CoA synthetase
VKIVDELDRPVVAGERGEILVSSVGVMAGYHDRPEETAKALTDGWFHSGDIGYLDPDGDLFVVDRKKEMIIRGGYNVYPREVEEVLYEIPEIAEVAVVGVPDPRLGEEVAAAVLLRPGTSLDPVAVRDYARGRLAAYKYPRLVAIYDELPRSSTGKLLKRSLDPGRLVRDGRLDPPAEVASTESGGSGR